MRVEQDQTGTGIAAKNKEAFKALEIEKFVTGERPIAAAPEGPIHLSLQVGGMLQKR